MCSQVLLMLEVYNSRAPTRSTRCSSSTPLLIQHPHMASVEDPGALSPSQDSSFSVSSSQLEQNLQRFAMPPPNFGDAYFCNSEAETLIDLDEPEVPATQDEPRESPTTPPGSACTPYSDASDSGRPELKRSAAQMDLGSESSGDILKMRGDELSQESEKMAMRNLPRSTRCRSTR